MPTTTNQGTINIGSGGELRLELQGNPIGAISIPGFDTLVSPQHTSFVNNGTIKVNPGGAFSVYSADGVWGTDATGKFYSTFVNNGAVNIDGAAGQSTNALIEGALSGSGTLTVDGGTQTDPTKTTADLAAAVSNTNIVAKNATVSLEVIIPLGSAARPQFIGGSFSFGANSGELSIKPNITTDSLVGVFDMPIHTFKSGDAIDFGVHETGVNVASAIFAPIWNQAHNSLTISEVSTDFFGHKTTTEAAQFTLAGTYSQSSFFPVELPYPVVARHSWFRRCPDYHANVIWDGRITPASTRLQR